MKLVLFTICSLVFLLSGLYDSRAQNFDNVSSIQVEDIFEELVAIRNDLHDNPELAGSEKRTSIIVKEYLQNLGLVVKTGFGGYGVVGILKGKIQNGKKVAWRADMDAALHTFNNKPNANPQAAHICGHDVHTTIGLGIANMLSKIKDSIGTVYFIFQPAEESFKGAKNMIENGLFKEIQPDEIFGLHVFPTEVGTVSSKPGELFAYQRRIKLIFDKSIDEKGFKSFFENTIQEFVRHKSKSAPWSLKYLTHPDYGLENPNTIYKNFFIIGSNIAIDKGNKKTSFECTYYETDSTRLETITKEITHQVENSKYGKYLLETSFTAERPTVVNDPKLTYESLAALKDMYGDERVTTFYGQVPYSNEDFIYYQYEVPGVMFLLGASNKNKGIVALPHTSEFMVDEEVIKHGVNYFSFFLKDRTNHTKVKGN
ncbi:M20 metallopeptidase family protein [Eudoraea chungangensis]|uniref:M20 metallopeptidase family protein n=1 Tax=Eudoraea chungangensis TaxID=1481905 RepID=UPI0023EDB03B|nr:M20 family metallopeptidase [Eudoraea chungangensis]